MKQTRQIQRDALYSRGLKKIKEPQAKANPNKLTIEYNRWLERKIKEKNEFIMLFLKERFSGDIRLKRLEHYLELLQSKTHMIIPN